MEKAFATISKGQFIRNARLPVCFDCLHFIQTTQKTGKCRKFGEKNIITGKISYIAVEEARATETICSQKGNYFEKKIENL